MSNDIIDDDFIGPMPSVKQDTKILTAADDTEISLSADGFTQDQVNKDEEMDDNNNDDELVTTMMIHQQKDDSFISMYDRDNSDEDDDSISDNRPPSPQPLFLRSEVGHGLDGLVYDDLIERIAETNTVDKPWCDIRTVIRSAFLEQCTAVETVISDSDVLSTINGIKTNILHSIDHHEGTPFSIQRLCELIRSPTRHYRLFIKYLYAIEKVLSVASTWESFYGETLTESTESHQNITDFITNYETPQVTMSPIQCNRFDTDDDDDDGDDIDKNNNDDDEEEVNDDSNNNNDDDNEGEVNDDDSNNNNDDDEKEVANDDEEQSEQHNDDTGIDTTSGPSNDIQQDSLHGSGQVDHNKEDNNNDVARIDDQDTTHINGSSDDSSDDINGAGENDNDKKDDGGGLVDSSLHTDNEPTTTQDEKQQAKRPIKTDTGSNNKRKRGPSNQDKNKIRKTTDDSNLP